MELPVFTLSGKSSSHVVVDDIFNTMVDPVVLQRSLIVARSNERTVIAHTKNKGEVRGGGRKPFRQKGTGNSRQGSITNPHNAGGGIAFGPRNTRNFSRSLPLKERRLALFGALSLKAADNKITILDIDTSKQKVKDYAKALELFKDARSVLVYDVTGSALLTALRSHESVTVKNVCSIRVEDILKTDAVVFTKAAIEAFQKPYIVS